MPESDRWGNVTAGEIAQRLAVLALSKRLGWPVGDIVAAVVLGGSDSHAAQELQKLKQELQVLSAKMDQTLDAVKRIAQDIEFTQLVLEAQPAADRIMTKFAILSTLRVGEKHHARQLVDAVLDMNSGVLVDLATLHAVIVGIHPVDPGPVSLIEAWIEKAASQANVAAGITWINKYFDFLAQLQLRGLLLAVNAFMAEKEEDLALELIRLVAGWLQEQVRILRTFRRTFFKTLPFAVAEVWQVILDAPFAGNEQGLAGFACLRHVYANDFDVTMVSDVPGLAGNAMRIYSALDNSLYPVNLAAFNGTFYGAALASYNVPQVMAWLEGAWRGVFYAKQQVAEYARPALAVFRDRLFVGVSNTIFSTDGRGWQTSSPLIGTPVGFFAHDDTLYAYDHESCFELAVSDSGAVQVVEDGRALFRYNAGRRACVFQNNLCFLQSEGHARMTVRHAPLATLAEAAKQHNSTYPTIDFNMTLLEIPNPDGVDQFTFGGVVGDGAFQVAFFSGINRSQVNDSDHQVHLTGMSWLV